MRGNIQKNYGKKLLHYKSGTQVPLFSYHVNFERLAICYLAMRFLAANKPREASADPISTIE